MSPFGYLLRFIIIIEDRIVETILRSPGFHRGVRAIHRRVHERKYGRDPNEPLYQGEATADPNENKSNSTFFKYFFEELKNQWKGTPTNPPPPPKKP